MADGRCLLGEFFWDISGDYLADSIHQFYEA